jgi:hypothetical protein
MANLSISIALHLFIPVKITLSICFNYKILRPAGRQKQDFKRNGYPKASE